MPRMFKVMETVAKFSCDYVRHGRWACSRLGKDVMVTITAGGRVYQEIIKHMNKALTKIIKYFSRAVDAEALHFPDETDTSFLFARPTKSIGAPIDRLPAEIWQDILLLAIGSDGYHPFATTCTTSTFLHFLEYENDSNRSYVEYLRRRAPLRRVCRAWNEFLESTDTWWVRVQDPYHPQKSFGLPPIADQVAIVKRLSMTITTHECVGSGFDWAFDLFQKVQAPISSYTIRICVPYNYPLIRNAYDFLVPVTAKMALRNLCITCPARSNYGAISFSQLSANFRGSRFIVHFRFRPARHGAARTPPP